MATPTEIVTTAAGAFVGAMGTDTWGLVRARCAEFFGRHTNTDEQAALEVRLDGFERDLAAVPAEDREDTVRVYTRSVARDLQPLADRSPQAAEELAGLVADLAAATGSTQGSTVINSGVRIAHNKVNRDLNFGGHTNAVGEQS
ncbi:MULTISPECIES: hypothetical protein [unclassified Streptomyces]|uniref:hypothetical protein n=1 Tax=unclassified Streptomyces TaxID=2593676 RepID=UPI0034277297